MIIEKVRIESILKTLENYGNVDAELVLLDKIRHLIINGGEVEGLKTEEIESEVKQWLLEIAPYLDNKELMDKLVLKYTVRNMKLIFKELGNELGESGLKAFKEAKRFRSFLRQRLNDAIAFREFVQDFEDTCKNTTLVAFIREPARDENSIAIEKDGEILYKTKFKAFNKALILTNESGYSSSENAKATVDYIKYVLKEQTFRESDDNSIFVTNSSTNRKYQITTEETRYIRNKIRK